MMMYSAIKLFTFFRRREPYMGMCAGSSVSTTRVGQLVQGATAQKIESASMITADTSYYHLSLALGGVWGRGVVANGGGTLTYWGST